MCKQQWLLNYIFHEPKQSGFFAQYGSFIHSVLESHLKKEITADEALIFYITNFDRAVTGRAPNEKIRQNFFKQGVEYFDALDFPHKNIISVEEKIEFEVAGIPFVARLDVLSKDNGIVLTDNKSHPLKPYSEKHKTAPKKYDLELDQYMRQQILYAHAVKQKYGFYPDRIELNLFRKKEFIVVDFEEEMVEPVLEWAISTRANIINTINWKPTIEYFPCNFLCDMKASCPYYQQTRGVALG